MTAAPGFDCLPDIVRAWSVSTPDKVALIDADRTLSYAQLDERSERHAAALAELGVPPGSCIGYLGRNSVAFFEIWIGANKAGCALTPLNWRCAAAEIAEVVSDAELPLIVAGPGYTDLADQVRSTTRADIRILAEADLDEWPAQVPRSETAFAIDTDSTSLLTYTSGTTAAPKGVPITHRALLNWFHRAETEPAVSWTQDDIGLMVMPNFHLAGSWVSLPALYHGASLAILPAFEPSAFLAAVALYRPTVTCLVPTAIQILLDSAAAQPDRFSSLRRILYAGSPIGQHTLSQALRVFGCDLVQFYGTTETFIITLLRPDQHQPDRPELLRSCGQPMPGVEVRIVDPHGRDVIDGTAGEVLVRSPWMFDGYWRKPDATAAATTGGWYRTGDAGIRDTDGNLSLVDRLKDMIVSGGENIYSAEVERALASHPDVDAAAVVGAPDRKWGERVVAFVVPRNGTPVEPADLVSHCRNLIAGYKVPKDIHVTDALPLTASGKVLKTSLRQRLQNCSENPEGDQT